MRLLHHKMKPMPHTETATVRLDRLYFALPGEAFKRFTAMLDRPPKDNPKLRRLLMTKAPWDQ